MLRTERYRVYAVAAMYAGPIVTMIVWAWAGQASRSIVAIPLTAALMACLIAVATRTWRIFFLIHLPVLLGPKVLVEIP